MKGNEFLDKMELIDPSYVKAADAKTKREKTSWVKWSAMAACLCLLIVGASVILNRNQSQRISFNEVTYVMYSAPLYGTSVSESISAEEATEILGFEITSAMPSSMRSFDFSYSKVLERENGTLIGVTVEGCKDASVYQSPGIYLTVTIGSQKPSLDYEEVNQAVSSSTINGKPVFAYIVPEQAKTTDSGAVKTIPPQYSVLIDDQDACYFVESRGTLSEDEIITTTLGIIEAISR